MVKKSLLLARHPNATTMTVVTMGAAGDRDAFCEKSANEGKQGLRDKRASKLELKRGPLPQSTTDTKNRKKKQQKRQNRGKSTKSTTTHCTRHFACRRATSPSTSIFVFPPVSWVSYKVAVSEISQLTTTILSCLTTNQYRTDKRVEKENHESRQNQRHARLRTTNPRTRQHNAHEKDKQQHLSHSCPSITHPLLFVSLHHQQPPPTASQRFIRDADPLKRFYMTSSHPTHEAAKSSIKQLPLIRGSDP